MSVLLPLQPGQCEWERLALLPSDPEANSQALVEALVRGGQDFVELLLHFNLAALWYERASSDPAWSSVPEMQRNRLRAARLGAVARYLAQQLAVAEVDRLFGAAGIPYAVMKGALVRERLPIDPSVREADDIDVLVSPADRQAAARLLVGAGFKMHLDVLNVSHEISLQTASADIDLHWNVLRPGRTRTDLTAELLSRRIRVNGFWGLSDSDSTFIMLVHPAFQKYVCAPHMGLARVLDFLLWSTRADSHWQEVMKLLDRAGVKAAAWATLTWFEALAPQRLHPRLGSWRNAIRPGPGRARYLELWLRHNLPSRLIAHPLPIQFGWTAFLHDRPSDALVAYRGWRLQGAAARPIRQCSQPWRSQRGDKPLSEEFVRQVDHVSRQHLARNVVLLQQVAVSASVLPSRISSHMLWPTKSRP